MLIEDKAEKRKCQGRGTGLCNLLLNDSSLRRTTCCSIMVLFFWIILHEIKSYSVITLGKLHGSVCNCSVDDPKGP